MTIGEIRSRDSQIEELIAQMSCGEIAAMGKLYELIETDVYAYALSKTANKQDAEDVTHDTFVQIWKKAKQYTVMGKPLAWIFTVEMNLIRKQFHKSQRFVSLDEAIEVDSGDGDFTETILNNEFLGQILNTLNEEEREIIVLHIVSGLKHREIAKLLKKPLSTVLSRYNRAIKKLQAQAKNKEERI